MPEQQTFDQEIKDGHRFKFGDNWASFLETLDIEKIIEAENALKSYLSIETLEGKTFLDIGSGSGLHSLVARRLGAKVHSIDYDPTSVWCTAQLKDRFFPDDNNWIVEQGSALDANMLSKLDKFDIVYSWGVLHHTGSMWEALKNVTLPVKENGQLFIAIYNNQGWISSYWLAVKKLYNANSLFKALMIILHFPYLYGVRWVVRTFTGRLKLERGMNLWRDMLDWLGGLPFEVASPEEIKDFYAEKGLSFKLISKCGSRHGCNEFLLTKEK